MQVRFLPGSPSHFRLNPPSFKGLRRSKSLGAAWGCCTQKHQIAPNRPRNRLPSVTYPHQQALHSPPPGRAPLAGTRPPAVRPSLPFPRAGECSPRRSLTPTSIIRPDRSPRRPVAPSHRRPVALPPRRPAALPPCRPVAPPPGRTAARSPGSVAPPRRPRRSVSPVPPAARPSPPEPGKPCRPPPPRQEVAALTPSHRTPPPVLPHVPMPTGVHTLSQWYGADGVWVVRLWGCGVIAAKYPKKPVQETVWIPMFESLSPYHPCFRGFCLASSPKLRFWKRE